MPSIVWISCPVFKRRQKILITSPEGVRLWKIKKGGGTIVQWQVFLKGAVRHFSCLILSRFIIFNFRNYFILFRIALYIALCYHKFMKKSHSKLSKNEPKIIPYKLRFISLFVKEFLKTINRFLIESNSWFGKLTLLIFV